MKTIRIKKNYKPEDDLGYLINEVKVEALKQALKVSNDDDVILISNDILDGSFEVSAIVV